MKSKNCIEKNVSIILVNYKNYKDTIKCLDSLKKVMYQNLSIIVVDNNSKDDSFEILKEYEDDRIIVMESGFNRGFAFGNNFGIRKALENDSDYVLLLNNDTVVDSDFLMALTNLMIIIKPNFAKCFHIFSSQSISIQFGSMEMFKSLQI